MAEVLVQHATLGSAPTGTNVLVCCALSVLCSRSFQGTVVAGGGGGGALTWSGHSYLDNKAHLQLGFINTRPI